MDIRLSALERARLEGRFHELLAADPCVHVNVLEEDLTPEAAAALIEKTYYQTNAAALALEGA